MGAEAIRHFMAADFDRLTGWIQVHGEFAPPGLRGLRLEIGELDLRSVGLHEHRVEPHGPIRREAVAGIGDSEIQFLGALEIGFDFHRLVVDDGRAVERLSGGGAVGCAGAGAFAGAGAGSRRLGLALGIEIRLEVFRGDLGFHAIGGHFEFRGPDDGVEHQLALVVIAPAGMEMAAGEPEAAAAIGAHAGPGDGLRLLFFEHLALHIGVAVVRAFAAIHGLGRGDGGENGSDPLQARAEAHVEIPFVSRAERVDAVADRVLGQFLEIREPVRIYGPILFEIASEPVEEFGRAFAQLSCVRAGWAAAAACHRDRFAARASRLSSKAGFDGVVQANEAATAFHFLREIGEPIALESDVSATTVGVKNDGIGMGEFLGARPLGIEMHLGDRPGARLGSGDFGEQLRPRHCASCWAGPMRRLAGHEAKDERLAIGSLRGNGAEGNAEGETDGDEEAMRVEFHTKGKLGRERIERRCRMGGGVKQVGGKILAQMRRWK